MSAGVCPGYPLGKGQSLPVLPVECQVVPQHPFRQFLIPSGEPLQGLFPVSPVRERRTRERAFPEEKEERVTKAAEVAGEDGLFHPVLPVASDVQVHG